MVDLDPLKLIMDTGDVLFLPGSGGRFADIGTAGGFLGHFIVVLSPPRRIQVGSEEAKTLAPIWPADTQDIWQIHALESTRRAVGLSQISMLIRIEPHTGKLRIFGEIDPNGDLAFTEDEAFELWQSPWKLRRALQPELMAEVVEEMLLSNGSWSMTTAARAIFRSASSFSSVDKDELLKEIMACWSVDPICTSVVVLFWQRYACKLISVINSLPVVPIHPSDLIMISMPVKADRCLPGDILRAMKDCGWTMISSIRSS
jgi:hypothetical protein